MLYTIQYCNLILTLLGLSVSLAATLSALSIYITSNVIIFDYSMKNTLEPYKTLPSLENNSPIDQAPCFLQTHRRESQAFLQLKKYFIEDNKNLNRISLITEQYEKVIHLLNTNYINSLLQLEQKMAKNDFINFLASLSIVQKTAGTQILEKGRKNHEQYILLSGEIGYYQEFDTGSAELECIARGQIGEFVCLEAFLANRFSSYTVTCIEACAFVVFCEEVYNKFIKKIVMRRIDQKIKFVQKNVIFEGINDEILRKNSHYFLIGYYKYKDVVYQEGSEAKQLYLILEGQVELTLKNLNLVKLGKGEFFGHDYQPITANAPIARKYYAVSVSAQTKLLIFNVHILRLLSKEYNDIISNIERYNAKSNMIHNSLIDRNTAVVEGHRACQVKKRKKRKTAKNKQIRFEWWGLAQNSSGPNRWRKPVKNQIREQGRMSNSLHKNSNSLGDHRSSGALDHKIEGLKKRIMRGALQQLRYNEQLMNNRKEGEESQYKYSKFVTQNRLRIKMIDSKPKAIDTAQATKKKLLNYAKKMDNFCDKLDFE